jgi:hypothetical protein
LPARRGESPGVASHGYEAAWNLTACVTLNGLARHPAVALADIAETRSLISETRLQGRVKLI